ncbi:MAG: hypothetical protein LBL76_06630 [Treponema sp.]|jgi:hypothetical protein|nr:hypothetical protein [Treponema sp.]
MELVMILYETINTQRISGRIPLDESYSPDELYSSEMPTLMALWSVSSPEPWQYSLDDTDHFSYPILAFDEEDDEDEDIGEEDNFDDLDDDFDEDFDDDFDDDDFDEDFDEEDFDDDFEDEDFDE